jgi:hypothetical protein
MGKVLKITDCEMLTPRIPHLLPNMLHHLCDSCRENCARGSDITSNTMGISVERLQPQLIHPAMNTPKDDQSKISADIEQPRSTIDGLEWGDVSSNACSGKKKQQHRTQWCWKRRNLSWSPPTVVLLLAGSRGIYIETQASIFFLINYIVSET